MNWVMIFAFMPWAAVWIAGAISYLMKVRAEQDIIVYKNTEGE